MQRLCSPRQSLLLFVVCGAAVSWRGVVFFPHFQILTFTDTHAADGRISVTGELAPENTTLTPELRSRIVAGVIVALNPSDGDGPVFHKPLGERF